MEFGRHFPQKEVYAAAELSQLGKGGEGIFGLEAAFFVPRDGQEPSFEPVLHGFEDVLVPQEQAVLFVFGLLFFVDGVGGGVPPGDGAGLPFGGIVEDARRNDVVILAGAVLLNGEEVEQHLQVQAVKDVGELELLAAALVVDDTDIGLSVVFIEIDPVHRAADSEGAAVGKGQGIGGDFLAAADGQFKVGGDEVGDLQLLLQPLRDVVEDEREPVVEVLEPGGLVGKAAEVLFRVD